MTTRYRYTDFLQNNTDLPGDPVGLIEGFWGRLAIADGKREMSLAKIRSQVETSEVIDVGATELALKGSSVLLGLCLGFLFVTLWPSKQFQQHKASAATFFNLHLSPPLHTSQR